MNEEINKRVMAWRSELAQQMRDHYEEVSNAAMSWNSDIRHAIDAWEHQPELLASLATAQAENGRLREALAKADRVIESLYACYFSHIHYDPDSSEEIDMIMADVSNWRAALKDSHD